MKLTHAEIAALCRGLSRLLHGGLSLNEGAFLLAEGEQGTLKALLTAMGEAMDSGSDLHEAMVSSGAFPPHVYGMVKVGEASGRLEEALEGLADYYDERVRPDLPLYDPGADDDRYHGAADEGFAGV